VFLNPFTGEEAQDHGFIDFPGGFVVDVLGTGIHFEFGFFEESLETAVFLEGPLTVHEQAETFFEGEAVEVGLLELFFKSFGHAEEFQSVEFIKGLFVEHGFSFHW
jgi:hypothetical protein